MDFKIDPRIKLSVPTEQLTGAKKKEKDLEALRASTREFEALYVNEMFKAMRKTVPEDSLFKKDMTTKMFQEMIDMELARDTAKNEGMGIGLAMYNQMKGAIENKR